MANLDSSSELNGKKAAEELGQRLSTTARPLAPFPALSPAQPRSLPGDWAGARLVRRVLRASLQDLTNDRADVQVSGWWSLSWAAPPPFIPVTLEFCARALHHALRRWGCHMDALRLAAGCGFCPACGGCLPVSPLQQRDPMWALWMPD